MPAGDHDDTLRVRSWITPKAVKGGASAVAGQGAHAVEPIAAGEVVAVKGGHVMDGAAVASLPEAIRDSAFPIAADCFLAAVTREEFDGVMMRVNHSCEPNVGMAGNVVLVAMRDRRVPGCGAGHGLQACRRGRALPGMVLLVAPAGDRVPAPGLSTSQVSLRRFPFVVWSQAPRTRDHLLPLREARLR